MTILTRDDIVTGVERTAEGLKEFFGRWRETPEWEVGDLELCTEAEPEVHPPLTWEHVPFSPPNLDALRPEPQMGGWYARMPSPSVTLNINVNMLSDEEYVEILKSLQGVKNAGDVISIVHEELANGSVEIEVESYSIGCDFVGRGELSITGQMNLEDVHGGPGHMQFGNVIQGQYMSGWSHMGSLGVCTPSRDSMITGLAVNGQAR